MVIQNRQLFQLALLLILFGGCISQQDDTIHRHELFNAQLDNVIIYNLEYAYVRQPEALQFQLKGSKIVKTVQENESKWRFELTDITEAQLIIKQLAGSTWFHFHWPGSRIQQDEDREVCFHLGKNVHWFNTAQQLHQSWPMNLSRSTSRQPLNALPSESSEYQHIIEHLFFASNGFAIRLDPYAPLWFRLTHHHHEDPMFCITAQSTLPYNSANTDGSYTDIQFDIFTGPNIKETYRAVANRLTDHFGAISRPKELPDEHLFVYSIWNLGPAANESDNSGESVLAFAKKLHSSEIKRATIILDSSRWQNDAEYLVVDNAKIQNLTEIVKSLKRHHFSLQLTVSPFIPVTSSLFKTNPTLFVSNLSTGKPYLIAHNHALLDFSKSEAQHLLVNRLKELQSTSGVNGFVFEPISVIDSQQQYTFSSIQMQNTPILLATEYTKLASQLGNRASSVSSGHQTQNLPLFVHMSPRIASWSHPNGIRSIIPSALALSLAGYAFIIPHMISNTTDSELYIRWAQVCTLMPALALPEVTTEKDTEEIIIELVNQHTQIGPKLYSLAINRMTGDGAPILRPMWWSDPEDEELYRIEDQFLIGDELLVAPVLGKGQIKRDIYFPEGTWKGFNGREYTGPNSYLVEARLDQLPSFTKVN